LIIELDADLDRDAQGEDAVVADDARVMRATAALQANGISVRRATDAAEARQIVLGLIPAGSQVHHGSSQTLEATGIAAALASPGRYEHLRTRVASMDRATEADEMRRIMSAPSVMVGSVAAVTETGSLVAASASGSQLGPYASGAGRVILVVGTQKIVADLDEALRRVNEHVLPLENARALATYGVQATLNKLLIINGEYVPDRITVVFVDEAIGF
jgi:L-lactate utilization protein LutC